MTNPLPPTPSFRLDGNRALVVGASSGIGVAAAVALAEAGAAVSLEARQSPKLDQAVEANGPFDVLVNSAGLAIHGPALETKAEDYDKVFSINVRGGYFLMQAVAKELINAGKPGSLITISSQMAHVGGIDRAVYSATKHAVEGFTKSMAIEWGKMG